MANRNYHISRIEPQEINEETWFKISVECNMPAFICMFPTTEKAYLFSKYYRHLIVNQLYSVGPPRASVRHEA